MTMFKVLVLSSTMIAAGMTFAAAQSAPKSGSGSSMGQVSAATHCRDASGKVVLKTGSKGTGSATTGSAPGSMSGNALNSQTPSSKDTNNMTSGKQPDSINNPSSLPAC